jgi:hypothetical protein
VAALAGGANCDAWAQQPAPLPASAVMARGAGTGWQSQGGVVGPWWSGSTAGVQPPAADGGFWFGFPGLGFGGSQGSTRSLGGVGSTLTSMPGTDGMLSSGRLTPFVTGVVPVVGSGPQVIATLPVTGQAVFPSARRSGPPRSGSLGMPPVPPTPAPIRPSTPASRARARRFMAAGDQHLRDDVDGPTAARAALDDYRAAGRFAQDDCDIQIRQAILHVALGQPEAADRALTRVRQIDSRFAASLDAATTAAGTGPNGDPHPPVAAVAARGEAILREIASMGVEPPAADAAARSPLDWLEAAWKSHWSAAAAKPATGEP